MAKTIPTGAVDFEVVFVGHGGKYLTRQGPYKSELDALTAVNELKKDAPGARSWEIHRVSRLVVKRGEVIVR